MSSLGTDGKNQASGERNVYEQGIGFGTRSNMGMSGRAETPVWPGGHNFIYFAYFVYFR